MKIDELQALDEANEAAMEWARRCAVADDRIEALEAQFAKALDALDAIKLYSACGGSRRKAIETLALLDQPNNAKERPHD